MNDLTKLYSRVIKAHNEAPYHFKKNPDLTTSIKAYNPICGDRFELYLNQDGTKIDQAFFHGFGCAISKASTSLLIKSIDGKTLGEAKSICEKFLRFVNGDSPTDVLALPDEFLAFASVHDFPERYDCATLAWSELEKYLERLLANEN